MKTTEEIRREYVENSQKAKYNTLLGRCTPADQEAIKVLESLDIASGGQLQRLYNVYVSIKSNS